MTTTRRAAERSIETRLGRAGDMVDDIVTTARDGHRTVSGRTFRRIDALRANEARVRARARELGAADKCAWDERSAELLRDLDELDTQIAITTARLDADLAVDDAAFAAAVKTELDAWTAAVDSTPPASHNDLASTVLRTTRRWSVTSRHWPR
jgi:hypothetical protein